MDPEGFSDFFVRVTISHQHNDFTFPVRELRAMTVLPNPQVAN
jgi:hypothetical protein